MPTSARKILLNNQSKIIILGEVIFVDFEVKKQLEAARRILEDLRESL